VPAEYSAKTGADALLAKVFLLKRALARLNTASATVPHATGSQHGRGPLGGNDASYTQGKRRNVMAMMIFAGGCRSTTATGKVKDRYCNACPNDTGCELKPRARELARIIAGQWLKTRDGLPPQATPILYRAYSAEDPSGTIHCGQYDRRRRLFIEQGSGAPTPQDLVIAWMPIPKVPAELYQAGSFSQSRGNDLSAEHPYLD